MREKARSERGSERDGDGGSAPHTHSPLHSPLLAYHSILYHLSFTTCAVSSTIRRVE